MSLTESKRDLVRGQPAPEFSLKNVDNKTVTLKDFQGTPIVIIFMCNHCPYVISKMEEIGQIAKDYPQFKIICINSNDPDQYKEDSFANMKKIAKKYGYTYYLFDKEQDVARDYGAVCTPDPFVFDQDHRLVYHGRINNAMSPNEQPTIHDMRDVLGSILLGESIDEWFQPSIGCSIKWRM